MEECRETLAVRGFRGNILWQVGKKAVGEWAIF